MTMTKDMLALVHNYLSPSAPATPNAENEANDILTDYYNPDFILVSDSEEDVACILPSRPVIVFINSRSGGQLGGELLKTYRSLINKNQVFDIHEMAPDKVLHQLYINLEKHKQRNNILAIEIENNLRIVVAGGDGTAGWLLGVVSDLKLNRPPPIATAPLGTGNNLMFVFGWGGKNPETSRRAVEVFLGHVRNAKEMKIDRAPKTGPCDPIGPLELPHSLHAFHRVAQDDSTDEEDIHTFRGGFWNYFSMGMDAEISYAFHAERKLHPEKFKNQLANQSTYVKLGLTQGWFVTPIYHPYSTNIAQMTKIKIMKKPGGQWQDIYIPSSIRSVVCLNLPSFSGGLDPWGRPNKKKMCYRDLTPPYVDDGYIEVVGFLNAWHGLILLAPRGHGTRLAQANKIRFEFCIGAVNHTFMRIDGEPWKQPLPLDDETVVIEISHLGQVSILANGNCRSKSITDPCSPYVQEDEEYDSCDEEEEEVEVEVEEEKKKFGAADTFRIPEGIDISRLI